MRRNRVLVLFAVLFAVSTAVFWLGSVLADATIVNNEELTVAEGSADNVISNALLLANDPDAATAVLTYTLVTTPANGNLFLNGIASPLTPTATFLQTDIDANALSYTHDGSETSSDSFDFTVETSTTMASDTFLISITPVFDQTPVVDDQEFSVAENSGSGTPVGTIAASDADAGDSLMYTIIAGNVGSPFAVNSGNGDITVDSPTPLDFETNPVLTFTVEVEDLGTLTDTAVITVNVTNENDPPVLSPAGPFSVPENSADTTPVGDPITATDDDLGAGDMLTYTISAGDPDGVFGIGPSNGQIVVADGSLLDFESLPTSYDLTIQVEDNDGATDTEVVTVNVTNVNEAPTIDPATFFVNENSGIGTPVGTPMTSDPENDDLTYTITGGDDHVFDIDPDNGEIAVLDNTFLDFEALGGTPHFSLTVEVDDGEFTPTATITINVDDVNETPTISDNTFSINENSSNGAEVGIVSAADPDADDAGLLTFGILSGNTGDAFTIANNGSNNGRITVADTNQLDYETTQSFVLGIIVTDTGGLNNTANVTVNLNNLFDEDPTVNNATFSVNEGSPNGVVVGTVSATDPELGSGDELTFSIVGGNSGTVFAINSSSGQITVPDTSKLDADAMPTFNLTVQAIDKGGNIDTGTITVNVIPLPITEIYLPVIMNDYPPVEPNNNCSQAYGIGTGVNYEFTADDVEDWYAITLTSPQNVTVVLSSFEPAKGQLIAYGGTCSGGLVLLQNDGSSSSTKRLTLNNLAPGKYYIRVFSDPVTNTQYNLQVTFN